MVLYVCVGGGGGGKIVVLEIQVHVRRSKANVYLGAVPPGKKFFEHPEIQPSQKSRGQAHIGWGGQRMHLLNAALVLYQ